MEKEEEGKEKKLSLSPKTLSNTGCDLQEMFI